MEPLHWITPDDSGVSETIGFILIFSIVIAGIAIVTLYGYPLLLEKQVGADEKIMEKNMIVLQNDMKSLAYKTVPFKETSLKIGGGSLTVYSPPGINTSKLSTFTISNGTTKFAEFQPGELRYESVKAQTDLSLHNGAVVMRPTIGEGSTMIAEPRWFYDTNNKHTMVINLINITSTEIMAKEGIGTVQMTLGDTKYIDESWSPSQEVTIKCSFPDPEGNYTVAWDNYLMKTFEKYGMYRVAPGTPGEYEYRIPGVDELVIKEYEVQIKNI